MSRNRTECSWFMGIIDRVDTKEISKSVGGN
jgi:hypothetical protein